MPFPADPYAPTGAFPFLRASYKTQGRIDDSGMAPSPGFLEKTGGRIDDSGMGPAVRQPREGRLAEIILQLRSGRGAFGHAPMTYR